MPLRDDAQYHSVALPPERPTTPSPVFGQGPRQGSLYLPDVEVLAEIGRRWTSTPELCWFCLWDGYGWNNVIPLTLGGQGAPPKRPDPIPCPVRGGPTVHLPHRNYFLYSGHVEEATATFPLSIFEQSPNLWWPQDQSWCVATELDLQWTYVAGTAGMIDEILVDRRIEALPVDPADPMMRIEGWVQNWIDAAVSALFENGQASITTSMGTIRASLERPSRLHHGAFRCQSTDLEGRARSSTAVPLRSTNAEEILSDVTFTLTHQVLALAEL
ncbi:MAG TPA: hypothetical protein VGG38_18800 [Acidimicrobiales bacterium]|jgi:hypothetical protein